MEGEPPPARIERGEDGLNDEDNGRKRREVTGVQTREGGGRTLPPTTLTTSIPKEFTRDSIPHTSDGKYLCHLA